MSKKRKHPKASDEAVILPPKHDGVAAAVRRFVENDQFIPTGHAKKRLKEREVTILEIKKILLRKNSRNVGRDEFKLRDDKGHEINRWSYAFTGKVDERVLRVCVSITDYPKPLLIVTVVDET